MKRILTLVHSNDSKGCSLTNKGLSKVAYHMLDRLTGFSPAFFTGIFHHTFLFLLGNTLIFRLHQGRYVRKLNRIKSFGRILVVVDVGIGDAIMVQQSAIALRRLFPAARIDYLCNRFGGELLSEFPATDNVWNVFGGNGVPSASDLEQVRTITNRGRYDCIVNLSPFVDRRTLQGMNGVIHLYIPFAGYILHEWYRNGMPPHISFGVYKFIMKFFSSRVRISTAHSEPSQGNTVYVPTDAIETARTFLIQHNCYEESRLVYVQLHSSSPFTQPPTELQRRVLERILSASEVDAVLIDAGGLDPVEEQSIIGSLEPALRAKIIRVSRPPLPIFAVIVDACDVFVAGDGGPTHIAAARKIASSRNIAMRNATTVVTIFGATDSRMYGYDSELPDHLRANQDVPSKVFVANAPCRNVSCINKLGKTCSEVRCFDGLSPDTISEYIISHVHIREKSPTILETSIS